MRCEELSNERNSDIIDFYKGVFKSIDPTIIELLGTTGAGKTTFCQQFVDEAGKKILSEVITKSGNSTVMSTDIVILENTKNRLFLKARVKSDIISDLILFALNIDPEFKFDTKKSITDAVNKAGLKKSNKEIKVNKDLFHGLYNLFRTIKRISKFQEIAKDLQSNYTNEHEIINHNTSNKNLTKLLDDMIFSEFQINDFYGYSHEIAIDEEKIIEKTIIAANEFNIYKEQKEGFNEIPSYRILFEQATLVLQCDEKAKRCLPEKFKEGIVFRELRTHKKGRQIDIITNFKAINKIFLIPVATGGHLVDDTIIEELKSIILSESKHNTVVITKIDKSSSYIEYTQNDYAAFIENLKKQITITHNNLIVKLDKTKERNVNQGYSFDRDSISKKIIASIDNAYLSKITKDKQGYYDAELHKIVCKNQNIEEISVSDIDDIVILDNFHTIISSILERKKVYGMA
ncbi:hypothetical protein [Clostridium sp.]|jgi:hypothetical protein|uniref:hypothetical protein n=1 Tax=Clostridium sp. TaxID=1506 RepID=UPI003EED479D